MCDRAQGRDGGGCVGALRAGGRWRSRPLRGADAGRADGQRGLEPAAISIGARPHARRPQTDRDFDADAPARAPGAGPPRGAAGPGQARRGVGKRGGGGAGGRGDDAQDRGRLMAPVLVLMDESKVSMEALTLARTFASPLHSVRMDAIQPFAPDALAAILAQVAEDLNASAVFAAGTDRGNDVMARLAARAGLPFAANCTGAEPGDAVKLVPQRWGASLLETPMLRPPRALIPAPPHTVHAPAAPPP